MTPPLALIRSSTRFGMEFTRFWNSLLSIFKVIHSWPIRLFNCAIDEILFFLSRRSKISQIVFIGFKSGDLASHFLTGMQRPRKFAVAFFETWQGALSCCYSQCFRRPKSFFLDGSIYSLRSHPRRRILDPRRRISGSNIAVNSKK